MGYTKKWVPPTIPLRNDLAAWKTLFQDLHDNLILAGLVQTATPGQLDISAVSTLPADDTFEGFIEYAFDDALQATAPVVIKLEFGCGVEGASTSNNSAFFRSRTPRIRCTVYLDGAQVVSFKCPQGSSYSASITTQLTTAGASTFCVNEDCGFYGFVYGAGSRNKPFASTYGSYYGATFALFLQRPVDENGTPVSGGLYVYSPNLTVGGSGNNTWASDVLDRSLASYIAQGGAPLSRNDMAPRIGRSGLSASLEQAILEPIYAPSVPPQPFPCIASYWHENIADGTEFDLVDMFGVTRTFVALGRETSISVDAVDGQRAGIAMLFE